jgi:hypothetical protein
MERKIPLETSTKEMIIWKCGKNERCMCINPIREKDLDLSEEQILQNLSGSISDIS